MWEYVFSVIVPIYNEGEGMRRCVESLLRQSAGGYEVILVDDGSTDCSGKICDEYASCHTFLRTIHKENGGGVDARRVGIDAAKGRYIVFVDGDDYVEDGFIKHLHQAIQHEADLYILNSRFVYSSGEMMLQKENLEEGYIDIRKTEKWILCEANGCVWNKIYVADIMKENSDKLVKKITFGDDIYINLKYLRNVKKSWVQNTASYIYVLDSPTSVCSMGISLKRFCEMDEVYEEALRYMEEQKGSSEGLYRGFINSNLSVLVGTVAALVKKGENRKEILEAMEASSLVKGLSDFKTKGFKYRGYSYLIRKRKLRLCRILWAVRRCIKNGKS